MRTLINDYHISEYNNFPIRHKYVILKMPVMLCFIENNSQNLGIKLDSCEQSTSQVTCVRHFSVLFLTDVYHVSGVHMQRPEDSFGVVPGEGCPLPLRQAE